MVALCGSASMAEAHGHADSEAFLGRLGAEKEGASKPYWVLLARGACFSFRLGVRAGLLS